MMPTHALLSVHLVKSARFQMTTTSLAAAMIVPTVNTLTVTNVGRGFPFANSPKRVQTARTK